jgi:hypothetical protein
MRPERFDIVQLEAADLCYVPFFRVGGHLPGKGITDVAHYGAIQSGIRADMVYEGSGGCFSIAPCNTDYFAVARKTVSQLYLADHRDIFCPDLLYQFVLFRNARALHHFIRL